ncbi:CcdB family protein [Novosphingobium jiangmenense]|uniref:Toxin CcdB n=1 Tax=Novosphingobium jiangmenense TaxID=2791981 RepID=A0ABS0HL07_9SPHN|nr:CcdB family protein [Novosphingobium jiangmenense]MBF9152924.1 CcdB family protein [Novosphingobium jiangmenense]
MARFDVFRGRDGSLLLDCQADLLTELSTRIVVPLIVERDAPKPAARLNPVFVLDDVRFVMVTQFLAAVPRRELEQKVFSLAAEQDRIALALDMLLTGF